MSEPRRWWFRAESNSVVRDDVANIEHVTDPKNGWMSLVPEGLTLARIENLESQLKEANEALSWYADEKNWMTTRKDELHEARMTIAGDPDSFGQYSEPGLASTLLLIGGKRAREYLKKWEGRRKP